MNNARPTDDELREEAEQVALVVLRAYSKTTPEIAGRAEGAQIVDGVWHLPSWGCDTLDHAIDALTYAILTALREREERIAELERNRDHDELVTLQAQQNEIDATHRASLWEKRAKEHAASLVEAHDRQAERADIAEGQVVALRGALHASGQVREAAEAHVADRDDALAKIADTANQAAREHLSDFTNRCTGTPADGRIVREIIQRLGKACWYASAGKREAEARVAVLERERDAISLSLRRAENFIELKEDLGREYENIVALAPLLKEDDS